MFPTTCEVNLDNEAIALPYHSLDTLQGRILEDALVIRSLTSGCTIEEHQKRRHGHGWIFASSLICSRRMTYIIPPMLFAQSLDFACPFFKMLTDKARPAAVSAIMTMLGSASLYESLRVFSFLWLKQLRIGIGCILKEEDEIADAR